MSEKSMLPTPKSINLHQKSRLLLVEFSDGNVYELPCEYLRVFSPATEVRHADIPVYGKEQVNIERIEPQGQYAVRLVFDDGYDSGIYSWETLHDLGQNKQQNWQTYLERLEQSGISRSSGPGESSGPRKVRILYFNYLVTSIGKEIDEFELPDTVTDVQSLLGWLRKRLHNKAYMLQDDLLRVTVNKQFAEAFTRIDHMDEIALVPNSPYPPTAPNAK